MGARLRHGKETIPATDKKNRRALIHRSGKFAVHQTCFRQNGGKLLWEYLAIRTVNAYSVLIHQFAAEVGCVAHNRIAQNAHDAAGPRDFLFRRNSDVANNAAPLKLRRP